MVVANASSWPSSHMLYKHDGLGLHLRNATVYYHNPCNDGRLCAVLIHLFYATFNFANVTYKVITERFPPTDFADQDRDNVAYFLDWSSPKSITTAKKHFSSVIVINQTVDAFGRHPISCNTKYNNVSIVANPEHCASMLVLETMSRLYEDMTSFDGSVKEVIPAMHNMLSVAFHNLGVPNGSLNIHAFIEFCLYVQDNDIRRFHHNYRPTSVAYETEVARRDSVKLGLDDDLKADLNFANQTPEEVRQNAIELAMFGVNLETLVLEKKNDVAEHRKRVLHAVEEAFQMTLPIKGEPAIWVIDVDNWAIITDTCEQLLRTVAEDDDLVVIFFDKVLDGELGKNISTRTARRNAVKVAEQIHAAVKPVGTFGGHPNAAGAGWVNMTRYREIRAT